ncbi:MAG: hypothetical protein WDA29_09910 [Flavobacteriaceae bacterium]
MIIESIIENIISEMLSEASFSETDIPPHFFVVLPLETAIKNGLKDGLLRNFKNYGITDDKRAVAEFVSRRKNAIIILPGKETVESNNITRFMYDNLDYWLSGDLKNYLRLIGHLDAETREESTQFRFHLMMEIVLGQGIDSLILGFTRDEIRAAVDSIVPDKIRNASHFINLTKKIIKKLNPESKITFGDIKNMIETIVMRVARTYSIEGEWMINSEDLIIPNRSKIIVAATAGEPIFEIEDIEIEDIIKELKSRYSTAVMVPYDFLVKTLTNTWKGGVYFMPSRGGKVPTHQRRKNKS